MKKIMGSNVLISGLHGLGLEIAKNVILANVQHVTIHDNKTITNMDLASQFYATIDDLDKNRILKKMFLFLQLVFVSNLFSLGSFQLNLKYILIMRSFQTH